MKSKVWKRIFTLFVVTFPITLFFSCVPGLGIFNIAAITVWTLMVACCCGVIAYYSKHPEKGDSYNEFLDTLGLVISMLYVGMIVAIIIYMFM